MKKLLRMFVLLLAFVPCALLLTACGDDYDRTKNETHFKNAIDLTGSVGDNYTLTSTSSQTGMFNDANEPGISSSSNEYQTVIKVDGSKYSTNDGFSTSYSIDGITYTPNGDGSYSVSVDESGFEDPFSLLSKITDDKVQEFFDFAYETNSKAITTDGEDVKINLEFSQYLNTLISIIGETEASENDSLADLINNILAHYEVTLPVGEVQPENQQGQIENFLDELNDMTLQDVCDYIETNVGISALTSIKTAFAVMQLAMVEDADFVASSHTSSSLAIQYATTNLTTSTFEDMLALSLSELVEMVLLSSNPAIDLGDATVFEIAKEFLTSNSLSSLIASFMTEEETPTLMEIAQAKQLLGALSTYISFNKINLELALDIEDNAFVGASMKFALDLVVMEEEQAGELIYSFELSDIGTTSVSTEELTGPIVVDAYSVLIINESMIEKEKLIVRNCYDMILSKFFADGITILADDGETTLVKIEKETNEDTFSIWVSDEIVKELFDATSSYGLAKITTQVGDNTLTFCLIVEPTPEVE